MPANQVLIDYIREGLRRGYQIDSLRIALIQQGYNPADIEDSIAVLRSPPAPPPPDSQVNAGDSGTPQQPTVSEGSNRLLIGIVIVGIAVGVFAILWFLDLLPFLPAGRGGITDCGNNQTCFLEAMKDCSLAKIITIQESGVAGYSGNSTIYGEIKGEEDGKCLVYIKVEDFTVPQTGVDPQIMDILTQMKGSDMTCKMPKNSPDSFGEALAIIMGMGCEGPLWDISMQMFSYMQSQMTNNFGNFT